MERVVVGEAEKKSGWGCGKLSLMLASSSPNVGGVLLASGNHRLPWMLGSFLGASLLFFLVFNIFVSNLEDCPCPETMDANSMQCPCHTVNDRCEWACPGSPWFNVSLVNS